jgi:hypothetical protein
MAGVMDFHAFWNQALAALATATADDIAAIFGFHAARKPNWRLRVRLEGW